MRPIGGWAHMMSSTVQVAPKTGSDTYGKPTYGATVSYICHISRKPTIVLGMGGQQVVSKQSVWLNSAVDIQPTAQVTMSTGDVGSTESYAVHPLIQAVSREFDEDGPHHTVLYL